MTGFYPHEIIAEGLGFPEGPVAMADGSVLVPLDEASVQPALPCIREAQVESIAVSLLHAYQDPAHEKALAVLLRQAFPDMPL